jgi:hypothetical protein
MQHAATKPIRLEQYKGFVMTERMMGCRVMSSELNMTCPNLKDNYAHLILDPP